MVLCGVGKPPGSEATATPMVFVPTSKAMMRFITWGDTGCSGGGQEMSKTAVLISTGEELLTGETTDTNSAWLAGALWDHGFSVRRMLTAGDDLDGLVWAISEAARMSSVVICTGGLGPTVDDRTAEAVALWAGIERQESTIALDQIKARYAKWGRTVSETNRKQAFSKVVLPLPMPPTIPTVVPARISAVSALRTGGDSS